MTRQAHLDTESYHVDGALLTARRIAIERFVRARLTRAEHGQHAELRETHVSLVLLSSELVFKFNKPLNFGFVDSRTLAERRHYCDRELEFNRRFAPQL